MDRDPPISLIHTAALVAEPVLCCDPDNLRSLRHLLTLLPVYSSMLFWYAAETVTPEIEQSYRSVGTGNGSASTSLIYRPPPVFPEGITLQQRVAEDNSIGQSGEARTYEPVWHPGTGVDEEERLYRSFLLTVPEARRKLKGSIMVRLLGKSATLI